MPSVTGGVIQGKYHVLRTYYEQILILPKGTGAYKLKFGIFKYLVNKMNNLI